MSREVQGIYTKKINDGHGEVKIADEVVEVIAGYAAADVKGVASMVGTGAKNFAKVGRKALSKGVSVDVLEGIVTVNLEIVIQYGYSIKEVTDKVQEKVKSAIENMTGLEVADVNVRVASVDTTSQG